MIQGACTTTGKCLNWMGVDPERRLLQLFLHRVLNQYHTHSNLPSRMLYPTSSKNDLMDAPAAFDTLRCCVVISNSLESDARVLYANPAAVQALSTIVPASAHPSPQEHTHLSTNFTPASASSESNTPELRPVTSTSAAVSATDGHHSATLLGLSLSLYLSQASLHCIKQVSDRWLFLVWNTQSDVVTSNPTRQLPST